MLRQSQFRANQYAVILEPEPDRSAYNVYAPGLPEVHTWSAAIDEALCRAREAIELSLEVRAANGAAPPVGLTDASEVRFLSVEYDSRVAEARSVSRRC